MDLVAGPELLAKQPDRHLGDGHRVEGVDALPRRGGPWVSLPVKWTSKWETARHVATRRSVGHGWTIIAAWTPSNAPRSSIVIFPPPPSSAGVPSTTHGQAETVGSGAKASPAPAAVAAMMLWPQAWPTSGSASYSAKSRR